MKDLRGQKFGRWTAIEYCGNSQWLCECSCKDHTRRMVRTDRLTSGQSRSCGCTRNEFISSLNKKGFNPFRYIDSKTIEVFGDNGLSFICDAEDLPLINGYWWRRTRYGYWACTKDNREILLHRLLLQESAVGAEVIDHINHNTDDNRKANLRVCSSQFNNFNAGVQARNTSGVIGVRWNADKKRWSSQIGIDYKIKYLGHFKNKEDAIKARLAAERELYGEYAPQKALFSEYLD